jgi:hypothetical protein
MRDCDTACEKRAFASAVKVVCIVIIVACMVYTCSVLL